MKRKKMDKKYKFLIFFSIFIVLLSLIIYICKTERNLNPVEKVVKDVSLKICSIVYKPINYIKDIPKRNKAYKKYKELEEKYNNLKHNDEKIASLQKEIDELKKVLDIQTTLEEYDKINSTIVNRNLGYWYDTITIDKGEASGVKKGMAVVSGNGLIGKVVNTSYLYSTVRLLTSSELGQKVSVRVNLGESYVYGILSSYDEKNNSFIIEGISENAAIKEGMVVTTTGMSSIFPSDILVGKVKNAKKDHFDLTYILEVEPHSDFSDLSFVSVLKRKSEVE